MIKTKHFKVKIVKNTIINFETKPSIETILNYRRNGTDSKIVTELIELINALKKEEKVKTIKLRSFLLNDELGDPIKQTLRKHFNIKCNSEKANFWIDKFAFFATSLVLMDFKNMRRISNKTCLCIINL